MAVLRNSIVGVAILAATAACDRQEPFAPLAACIDGDICVRGTATHFTFEGGFWAVRGDDGVTYDPIGGLPTDVRRSGQRVYMVAKLRDDLGSFHMAGPTVELVSVQRIR